MQGPKIAIAVLCFPAPIMLLSFSSLSACFWLQQHPQVFHSRDEKLEETEAYFERTAAIVINSLLGAREPMEGKSGKGHKNGQE